MKKILTAAAGMTLILSGCAQQSNDMQTRVQDHIDAVLSQQAGTANRNKTYYSYYIEPSVGRYSSNETGNVFLYDGTKILMNLNVAEVVNSDEWPDSKADGVDDLKDAVISLEGHYSDSEHVNRSYCLKVYAVQNSYLTILNADTVNFYAIHDELQTASIASEMIKIARSVEVHTDAVLLAYTNHKKLDYKTEKIQLYNEVIPESGEIRELINDTNTIGSGDSSTTSQGNSSQTDNPQ